MTRKLKQALFEQKQATEQVNQKIPGLLGIPLGGQRRVEVPGRNAFVYVRLRNNTSEVIQAYNNKVAIVYNLPVLVHRIGGRYEVLGVDTERYDNNWSSFAPFLPRHGNTHSFPDDLSLGGGGDIVWVYPRQFMPALVFPSGSLGASNVLVSPYTLKKDDGSWLYVGNTGTQNFSPYRPVTGTQAVMALVYLDSVSGNPYFMVGSGSYFSNTLTGTSQIVPYVPSLTNPAHIPLAAVRLITGTNRISWDNIYDVRQWIHVTPTGSAGGVGTPSSPIGSLQFNNAGAFGGTKIFYRESAIAARLDVSGSSSQGLDFLIFAQPGRNHDDGGDFYFQGGDALGSGSAGGVGIQGGASTYGRGGTIEIFAGRSLGAGTGGDIELVPGSSGLGGPSMAGFVSINDAGNDWQHRFRTSGSTGHHDYSFPDESGVFLLDAPSDGTIYARQNKAWVASPAGSGGSSGVAVQEYGSFVITGTTLNFIGMDVSSSGSTARVSSLDGTQGFGYNYMIRTVADGTSGTFTTSLKAIGNVDASTLNPIILRIGEDRRQVTSALNVVLTSGTNYMNCGGAELTTKNVDLFVYAIWESSASTVRLGLSRIPWARTMNDFVNSPTDERYIFGNYSAFNADDEVEVIGRVRTSKAGILGAWGSSGGAVYSRPMQSTDWLDYTPANTGSFSSITTQFGRYRVNGATLDLRIILDGTSNATTFRTTSPFRSKNTAGYYQYGPTGFYQDNSVGGGPGLIESVPGTNIMTFYKTGYLSWTDSGVKTAYSSHSIEM